MWHNNWLVNICLLICSFVPLYAQQAVAPAADGVVPPVIRFSGVLADADSKPLAGRISVTFSLYKEAEGGSAVWMETQNVTPDKTGHYAVMLGSTTSQGVPASVFASGEAHWLGVQVQGQAEQPRTLLLSVPYALKAADAQTLGGLPPSAFVLAAPPSGGSAESSPSAASPSSNNGAAPGVSGSGTADYVPLWTDNNGTLGNSAIYQGGTAKKPKIGIGTNKPASTLDVKGAGTIRGELSLPATGTATASAGDDSQPLDLAASVFNSGTGTAVTQTFQWQAEPAGNNTGNASGSLNLLYGSGANKPAETGLNIASNGQIKFAQGQTFPGTGTITGVTAGTDLTGGGTSGNVTLNLDTTKVPQLNAANAFTGNQTVNGNLSASGVVSGSSYQIGSNLFAFGSYANGSAYLGFAGNTTSTGSYNTATGSAALDENTTGSENTASGTFALYANTTGYENTASGYEALFSNTTGYENTASGIAALINTTTGGGNTASGFEALADNTTADYNTATGYGALYSTTTGGGNTASGYDALGSNTTGYLNTAVGYQALYTTKPAPISLVSATSAPRVKTAFPMRPLLGRTRSFPPAIRWCWEAQEPMPSRWESAPQRRRIFSPSHAAPVIPSATAGKPTVPAAGRPTSRRCRMR